MKLSYLDKKHHKINFTKKTMTIIDDLILNLNN